MGSPGEREESSRLRGKKGERKGKRKGKKGKEGRGKGIHVGIKYIINFSRLGNIEPCLRPSILPEKEKKKK